MKVCPLFRSPSGKQEIREKLYQLGSVIRLDIAEKRVYHDKIECTQKDLITKQRTLEPCYTKVDTMGLL